MYLKCIGIIGPMACITLPAGSFDSRSQRSKANDCAPLSAKGKMSPSGERPSFFCCSFTRFLIFWMFFVASSWDENLQSTRYFWWCLVLYWCPGALRPQRVVVVALLLGLWMRALTRMRMKSEQKIRKTPLMIKANSEVESSTTLTTHRNSLEIFLTKCCHFSAGFSGMQIMQLNIRARAEPRQVSGILVLFYGGEVGLRVGSAWFAPTGHHGNGRKGWRDPVVVWPGTFML